MRLAVTPDAPHMPTVLLLAGLLGWLLVFTLLGTRSFEKRAIL